MKPNLYDKWESCYNSKNFMIENVSPIASIQCSEHGLKNLQSFFCRKRDLLFLIGITIEIEQKLCSRLLWFIQNLHISRDRQDV